MLLTFLCLYQLSGGPKVKEETVSIGRSSVGVIFRLQYASGRTKLLTIKPIFTPFQNIYLDVEYVNEREEGALVIPLCLKALIYLFINKRIYLRQ